MLMAVVTCGLFSTKRDMRAVSLCEDRKNSPDSFFFPYSADFYALFHRLFAMHGIISYICPPISDGNKRMNTI